MGVGNTRSFVSGVLAAAAFFASPWFASAQNYPDKPIRLVVGYAAGGPTDIVARAVSPALSDALGQQVFVENRVGANGTIAAQSVVTSPPDGYTLALIAVGTATIAPHIYAHMPYDPLKDLVPVSLVTSTPQLLAVNPSVPVKDVAELVALAKSKPGEVSIASVGVGSLSHIALELLKATTKANIIHVPFNGGAPAVTNVLGGHVSGVIADLPVLKALVKSGKLKGLGLAAPHRSPLFPELPTMLEQGIPVQAPDWYGIEVPAKTPPEVIAKLNAAIAKALKDPGVREKLLAFGAEATPSSPAEFGSFLKAEWDKWGPIVKGADIKAN